MNTTTKEPARGGQAAPKNLPTLHVKKGSRYCYCKVAGRQHWFGHEGDPETQRRFAEWLAEFLANGRRVPNTKADADSFRVADVFAEFLEHAATIYSDGALENVKRAIEPVLLDFGQLPVAKFGVSCLEKVQQDLADAALCRATIRARMNAIRRVFRWGEKRRLVPMGTWEHLRTLEHVRPGRTKATESRIVVAAEWRHVQPALNYLSTPLRAAALLQWHAGLRPGEVLALTGAQLDRSGPVWVYRPKQHKGLWKGRERTIRFGPKAQEILRPLLKLDPNAALISPRDALAEQKAEKARTRRTKVQPSQQKRAEERAANPKLEVAEFYDVNTYARAVLRACDRADVPRWSPHQLRHACAARLFEKGEFEAARAVLGHSRLDMTRHYAKSADARLASDAMLRNG